MTTTPRDSGKTVLYVSTNGAGLGHMTRLLALARRARAGVRPYFVSMSQAVPVVAAHGLDAEYIPSRSDLGIGTRRWNVLFRRRFLDLVNQERPVAVVFDGTYPYDGLVAGRSIMPDLRFVWSRRGMWRAGSGSRQLSRSRWFDLVIEPGDFAAEADRGLTAARTDALRVSPVTLLDHAELLGREEAAAMLGTDPTRPTALVTLGTTGVANLEAGLGRLADRLSKIDDFQIVVTRSMIADDRSPIPATIRRTSVYPISRALRAVDLAVAAAGYNSFHELLKFGVPSAFLPNGNAALDDQVARADWAQRAGVGLHIEAFDDRAIDRIATELGDPASRREFAVRCARLPQANGAGEAQCAVEDLVAGLGHGEHAC
jgi:UDP:flavonoid glycosyltransferase YjiC (YdhE family)